MKKNKKQEMLKKQRRDNCLRFFIISFLFSHNIIGQQTNDFSYEDSIANEISNRSYRNIEDLTKDLTKNLSNEKSKYRVIVKWISLNIKYEAKSKFKNCQQTVKKGEAKCFGFANLTKEMCSYCGIKSGVIIGDSKSSILEIGAKLNYNQHAWNYVVLNGVKYYSDVTWVTVGRESHTGELKYGFDEVYFLTLPEIFDLRHYPNKEFISENPNKISLASYKRMPLYFSNYFSQQFTIITKSGVVNNRLKIRLTMMEIFNPLEVYISFFEGDNYYAIYPEIKSINENETILIFNLKTIKNTKKIYLGRNSETFIGFRKK